jgi:hypothetical protein
VSVWLRAFLTWLGLCREGSSHASYYRTLPSSFVQVSRPWCVAIHPPSWAGLASPRRPCAPAATPVSQRHPLTVSCDTHVWFLQSGGLCNHPINPSSMPWYPSPPQPSAIPTYLRETLCVLWGDALRALEETLCVLWRRRSACFGETKYEINLYFSIY